MARKKFGTSVAIALSCAVAGVGLIGCDDSDSDADGDAASESPESSATASAPEGGGEDLLTGTRTITVGESSVNVSCSGEPAEGRPLVVLMHGGGQDLTVMADLQETLSAEGRACSYDRLGAGGSDQPPGPQDYAAVGETLTGVLDEIAGDQPVVLAGHSMGGLLAARYAPEHLDRVQGLVLLDATSPTAIADIETRIPESDTGPGGQLRAETLAVFAGQNPEQLVFADGEVASVGDIPVQVLQHGQPHLAAAAPPEYGDGLEQDWTRGQEAWTTMSPNSERIVAENSGHDIHLDEPELVVEAIETVIAQAAG